MEKIVIAIPALNEASHIESVIGTLMAQLPAEYSFQLVVADGGSTDGTADIVRKMGMIDPRIHVIHNERKNQSAGTNLIARQFAWGARYIIRADAHAAYPDTFISDLITAQKRTGADSIVIPMDSVGQTCFQRAVGWLSDTPLGNGGSAHRGGRKSGFTDHGHHALFVTERFLSLGGYDEPFTPCEDTEFDARQRRAGAKVYMDAGIRITYYPRASFSKLWRQYYKVGCSRTLVTMRHFGDVRARQLAVPAHLAVLIALLLISPFWFWAIIWPATYLAILGAASLYFALKHRSVCGLWAGPAALVMHTAYAVGVWHSLALNMGRWSEIVRSVPHPIEAVPPDKNVVS